MAGAAHRYPPLDLDALRAAISAGRQVRVGVLPTGQFPDGTAGRVRTVGTPDVDGPEFIQVELMVGGAKDVVPFAPTDLSPLRRGQSAPEPVVGAATPRRPRRAGAEGAATAGGSAAARAAIRLSLVPSGRTEPPVLPAPPVPPVRTAPVVPPVLGGPGGVMAGIATAETAIPRPTRSRRAAAPPAGAAPVPASETPLPVAPTTPDAVGPPSSAAGSRRSADRVKRQPITVTLATAGPDHTSWTVQVTVGSRTVVKPSAVPPAQAWTVVAGLGHPEVEKFVAGALADHRRQTQERADRLGRELAAAQAELAGYPDL